MFLVLHVLQPVGADCGCPGGQAIPATIKHGILYRVQVLSHASTACADDDTA